MEKLIVKSPAFEDNGMMPKKYTGFGEDISPAFELENLSENAKSIAIIMEDLDIPMTTTFTHWTIWNIPAIKQIPEHLERGSLVKNLEGAIQGLAWGKHEYRGPKQPFFIHKAHRYIFRFYVLDEVLKLSPDNGKIALTASMKNHIIQEGSITGVYQRESK